MGGGRDKKGRRTSPDDDHSGGKTTITRIRAVVPHDVNIRKKNEGRVVGSGGERWKGRVVPEVDREVAEADRYRPAWPTRYEAQWCGWCRG